MPNTTELNHFARTASERLTSTVRGEPEDQLRGPIEQYLRVVGAGLGFAVTPVGEVRLGNRIGRPDYAILVDGVLAGYVELKAPGSGARGSNFRGRDRQQFERFCNLPNILYSDGNEWALYQNGELAAQPVGLQTSISTRSSQYADDDVARQIEALLLAFLSWRPIPPTTAVALAKMLAPLCRLLRDDVREALIVPDSSLRTLAANWRDLLFPDASDQRFSSDYAQTVTFALLLSKAEGASTSDLGSCVITLAQRHGLLSRALQVLTDVQAADAIRTSLNTLQRVLDAVDPTIFVSAKQDPWLYFYEDFLQAYDPELRQQAGVYYTPASLVSAQVALVDSILKQSLAQPLGFAGPSVKVLDPAAGTGTYLLTVIDNALGTVAALEGAGAMAARASQLAQNLIGFEIMVGPFAVAELRLERAFRSYGANHVEPRIYLTNTLESPTSEPPSLPLFFQPIAQHHEAALRVKQEESLIVCLGNPPYEYHKQESGSSSTNWVRFGDGNPEDSILQSFIQPARDAGNSIHLKHLYDLYVYFWRWGVWKVFEQDSGSPGIVSFVTASSFITGKAFVGFREHLRHRCDEIWIIDLGGGSRGARKSENVFSIRSPVAICIAVRRGNHDGTNPAVVRYAHIDGNSTKKLQTLSRISSIEDLQWRECSSGWQDWFKPRSSGVFQSWPQLIDLFPWYQSGVQYKRTWPIGPTPGILEKRWRALLSNTNRVAPFKESRDRKIQKSYVDLFGTNSLPSISSLSDDAITPPILPYSYRSFDRQFVLADSRLGDYMRRPLWNVASKQQLYLTSLLTKELGSGPAAIVAAHVPDMDHFCNRGARDVIPLWRDQAATEPNVCNGLLAALTVKLGKPVSPEALFAYCVGILGSSDFTERFFSDLADCELRVPITKSEVLFVEMSAIGAEIIHAQTLGEKTALNFCPTLSGSARCVRPVGEQEQDYPDTFHYDNVTCQIHVGDGLFGPVSDKVWAYSVSDFNVIPSWLGYRMRTRRGRRGSSLNGLQPSSWDAALNSDFLRVLWAVESAIELGVRASEVLDRILKHDLLTEDDLPKPDLKQRRAPSEGELDLESA